MSSRASLGTSPARVAPDAQTSPCWWRTTMTPPTRCSFSFPVGFYVTILPRSEHAHIFPSINIQFYPFFLPFAEEPKVGIKTIKMYCQRMQEENITRAIIVVQMGMTPSAKQVNGYLAHPDGTHITNTWMKINFVIESCILIEISPYSPLLTWHPNIYWNSFYNRSCLLTSQSMRFVLLHYFLAYFPFLL